jgi:hypothetical protein
MVNARVACSRDLEHQDIVSDYIDTVYDLDSFSTPTPTRLDFFGIRIESVIPTSRFSSSVRRHGAITIISTSTWEDIRYWIIPAFLETGRRGV